MSDTCCEAKTCEVGSESGEGPYEETPQGKDLKRWIKYLRWVGIKFETKHEKRMREFREDRIRKEKLVASLKKVESTDFTSTAWDWGWTAIFEEIGGRGHFNIGPSVTYEKWYIGLDKQAVERDRIANRPITVTQILPFEEAYSGHSSIKLL